MLAWELRPPVGKALRCLRQQGGLGSPLAWIQTRPHRVPCGLNLLHLSFLIVRRWRGGGGEGGEKGGPLGVLQGQGGLKGNPIKRLCPVLGRAQTLDKGSFPSGF